MTWRRVLGAALLLAAVVSFVPAVLVARDYPLSYVTGLALQVAMFAAGLLLLRVPEHRRDGWWLVAATVFMGIGTLGSVPTFEAGYWNQLSWWVNWAPATCLVGPVLRLPDQPASPRTVRRLSVGAWIVTVGLVVVAGLFWDPAMNGYSGPARWLTLYASEPAYWAVVRTIPVAFAPIAIGITVAQLRRHRRAAGPNRLAVRLLGWSTIAMTWGLEGRFVLNVIVRAPWEVRNVADNVHMAFSAAAVLVVLVVAIGANLRRAGFLDALLAAGGDAPSIEAVLARYVADPTLRLRFRTEEGWTDAAGHPVDAAAASGRLVHPIVVEADGPVVVADLDRGLDPDSRLVGPLLDAAGVVLARARLSVQQAAQAVELRASRARIVEAGVQSRRQLERDLHDGAQQHLLAAQAALARAGLGGEPEAVSEAIAFAQSRLTTTMAELRGLARGQHPALLSQAGLAAALRSLAQLSDRVQVRIGPGLEGRRFAPVVEATAWFVASEGVVNALKYTDGGVTVTADVDDEVRIRIVDAGDGGAAFAPGGGLAGLRDRVGAAGGSLNLVSPTGVGTTLTAALPARPPEEEP